MNTRRSNYRANLDTAVNKTASYAPAAVDLKLDRFREIVVTLDVTAADAAGTYDFYLITGNEVSQGAALAEWDLVHFPQIANGTRRYVARLFADQLGQTVTTGAAPDLATNDPTVLRVDTSGSNQGTKTLAAGVGRHGPFGHTLRYELVAGGSPTTGVTYSVHIEARA